MPSLGPRGLKLCCKHTCQHPSLGPRGLILILRCIMFIVINMSLTSRYYDGRRESPPIALEGQSLHLQQWKTRVSTCYNGRSQPATMEHQSPLDAKYDHSLHCCNGRLEPSPSTMEEQTLHLLQSKSKVSTC